MTAQLDALIDAVEAGVWKSDGYPSDTWHVIFTAKLGLHVETIQKAFQGSLDAAKRLFDALLPGWSFNIDSYSVEPWAMVQNDGGEIEAQGFAETHARAWLIATLKAYRATVTPDN